MLKTILALSICCVAYGQTTTYSTTLSSPLGVPSSNVTNGMVATLYVASTANMVSAFGNNPGSASQWAFIDKEMMPIINVINSTTVQVMRGSPAGGNGATIPTAHISGAVVYFGPISVFIASNQDPAGACTATTFLFLPVIVTGTGDIMNCVNGSWALIGGGQTNPYPIPVAAGCVVSANGQICEDTTQGSFAGYANGLQANFERFIPATAFSYTAFPSGDKVCALHTDSGCANAANATVETPFVTTATIPANFLKAGKILKVTAGINQLMTATVPTEVVYLALGATNVCQTPIMSPVLTVLLGTQIYQWYIVAATAPSGSASVWCNISSLPQQGVGLAVSMSNSATQPSTIATNGSLVMTINLKYGAATTLNQTTLNYLFVEEVN